MGGNVADELKGKIQLQVVEILDGIPDGLDGIYKWMLKQISRADRGRAQRLNDSVEGVIKRTALIFQWIVLARRPMRLTELAVAIKTEGHGNQSTEERMRYLLDRFGLLLKVNNGVVNLVHQSAKEYLQREECYEEGIEVYRVKKQACHLLVGKACVKYVQSCLCADNSIEESNCWNNTLCSTTQHATGLSM